MATKKTESKETETTELWDFENSVIWDSVCKTDPAYTKPFNRPGGFKGTAINATYLVQRATQMFGPIGIGWGYEVEQEELMEGVWLDERTREIIHKIKIKVWYEWNGKRGEFPHYGQTAFVGMRGKYVFTDEEAPKKSLTDALTKALSMLGFAADVHMGLYDDNKYVNEASAYFAEQRAKTEQKEAAPEPTLDATQLATVRELIQETDTDLVRFLDYLKVNNLEEVPASQFARVTAMLRKKQSKTQNPEQPQ